MLDGINGFKFIPKERNQGLFLQDRFDDIIDNREWPPPSAESTDFVFYCTYRGKKLGEFTWHDYRGGLLYEQTADADDYLARVNQSSCLIICIPSNLLDAAVNGTGHENREARRAFDQYLWYLTEARAQHPDVPVVLAIMKADLFYDGILKLSYPGAIAYLKNKFDLLFHDEGRSVVITDITLGHFSSAASENVSANISPRHIAIPILFPFYLETRSPEIERVLVEESCLYYNGEPQNDNASEIEENLPDDLHWTTLTERE